MIRTLGIFANRMTRFRGACVLSVYGVRVLCKRLSVWTPELLSSLKSPKTLAILKQKLINQPVPELAPLSLSSHLSSFISSFLHPSIPPPLTPVRGGWGSSDAVTPGFPLSICCTSFHHSLFNLLCWCQCLFMLFLFWEQLYISYKHWLYSTVISHFSLKSDVER